MAVGIFRTLLALAVIIQHTGSLWGIKLIGGGAAVESFFIISGFYMTLILNSKYTGNHNYKLFITNRFLRIYPVYWVVLAATVIGSLLTGIFLSDWERILPYTLVYHKMGFAAGAFLFLTHLFIFGQDVAMFLILNIDKGALSFHADFSGPFTAISQFLLLPQTWTLSLELMFYLIAPFILRRNVKLVLCLIAASLLLRLYMYFGLALREDPWSDRFFPTEFVFFLLGNISFRIYEKIKDREAYLMVSWAASILFLLIFLMYQYFPIMPSVKSWGYFLLVAACLPFIFNISRNSKIDAVIGEFSYPIYLVHFSLIAVTDFLIIKFGVLNPQNLPWVLKFGFLNLECFVTILISVIASFVLLKFISDPIEKFRQLRWAKSNSVRS